MSKDIVERIGTDRIVKLRAVTLALIIALSVIPAGAVAVEDRDSHESISQEAGIGEQPTNQEAVSSQSGGILESLEVGMTTVQGNNATVVSATYDTDTVYAWDAETGEVLWSRTTGGSISSDPTVSGNTVYVGTGQYAVEAINLTDGSLEWSYTNVGSFPESSPTIVNGTVYIGSDGLYALDSDTGSLEWSYTAPGDVTNAPNYHNGTVYFGSDDNSVYAVDAATGNQEWSFATGGSVKSAPTYANGTVYVGSNDNNLYALDASTGNQEWSYNTGGTVSASSPVIENGSVYIGGNSNQLHSVDTDTGSQEWTYSAGSSVNTPSYASGTVYITYNNELAAVDPDTGNQIWTFNSGNGINNGLTVQNGLAYFGGVNSGFFAVDTSDGSQVWSDTSVGDFQSAPTIVGADAVNSTGSRVMDGSLGHIAATYDTTSEVTGQVTNTDGYLIESATVSAYDNSTGNLVVETTTDSNGEYSFELEDRDYTIEATESGYTDNSTDITVSGSDITGVDLTLQECMIHGTVTDRTGEGIAVASVTIEDNATGDRIATLTTNETGYYEYSLQQNGTYDVEAVHDDQNDILTVNYTTPDEQVDLQIDKYYASGNVTVEDSSGSLISGQNVSLEWASTESEYETSWGMRDGSAEMDYAFDDATHTNNETYELTVSASGYRPRTVIVNDTKNSYTVTLNDDGSSHWQQEFNLQDYTEEFDPETSYLILEAYNDTSLEWEVIDGTHFGIAESTTQIQTGERYRLYVQNEEGDRATAGELVPEDWSDEPDHVVTVTVGSEDTDNDDIVNRNAGDSSTDTVHLDNPPIADFVLSPDDPITGETVTLDGSASRDLEGGIVSYVWTVDGDQVATGESASWTPSESGVREITLEVEDDTGQTDSESLSVYVGASASDRNSPPNVRMNASRTTLEAGESVTFNGSGSNDTDGNITEYRWDFDGDGTIDATSEQETIDHTYADGGIYRTTLIVVDEDGSTNSTSVTISVEGEQKSEGSGGGFGGPIPGAGATPDSPFGLLMLLLVGGGSLLGVWYLDQRTKRDIPTVAMGIGVTIFGVVVLESLAPGTVTIPLARALGTVGPLVWILGIGGGIWLIRRWLSTRETEARASKLASWARRK